MKTVIKGIGAYLPEKEVSSAEMEEMAGYEKFGVKIGLCKMLTGCESRHWSKPDELCSDIAAKAGKAALENAGVSTEEVDALIFASVSHDTKLISSGFIESFDVISLLSVFEDEFDTVISLENLEFEDFNTVPQVVHLIEEAKSA